MSSLKTCRFIKKNVFIQIPETVMAHVTQLAPQLRMDVAELVELLCSMAQLMMDHDFVKQILAINDSINSMSADN
jgi:hypothetical protein